MGRYGRDQDRTGFCWAVLTSPGEDRLLWDVMDEIRIGQAPMGRYGRDQDRTGSCGTISFGMAEQMWPFTSFSLFPYKINSLKDVLRTPQ